MLDSGWRPPKGEPEFSYDPETGLMEFVTQDGTMTVNLLEDPACLELPVYGRLFARTLKEVEQFG